MIIDVIAHQQNTDTVLVYCESLIHSVGHPTYKRHGIICALQTSVKTLTHSLPLVSGSQTPYFHVAEPYVGDHTANVSYILSMMHVALTDYENILCN